MDWSSSQTHWLVSPTMKPWDKAATKDAQARTKWVRKHIWIASSGTTRSEGFKWVGLSKDAFLAAAESLNRHVGADRKDVWLNVLPTYHVGGLTTFARAHVLGGRAIDLSRQKWNAAHMIQVAQTEKAAFISLVPTQLYDLVKEGHRAPESLRAAFLGGAALDERLYVQARDLGWPILTCYGMTETCAQVATASLESLKQKTKPKMQILSHAELQLRDRKIAIRANSLATYVMHLHPEKGFSLEDPKRDGWFVTEDLGEIENGFVTIAGRTNDRIKILGEMVSLLRVEEELKRFVSDTLCVFSILDARRGQKLIAVLEKPKSLKSVAADIARYHQAASALWHLDHWYAIDQMPRSPLGKILKAQILSYLGL